MKELKLMNLTLKNFKGIKKFEVNADGWDSLIYGDNGTGKTTLFDSFVWLLFNKDSNNRADFAIKTLKDGKEINNLEHEVEAHFRIDGQPLVLRKVYKEKWTKKRGAPIAEFTGHVTDHYIDGVPVKKKEYEEKVDSIVKEEVFKLLTSPTFFNENLKWQDRRATLLEVCGDVEEEDVLAFNNELKDLPTILKGRTIEDHRKVIAARRAEINKELNMIPVRIDEINNSMPKEDIDVPSIEAEVATIEKQLDEHATQINNIKNGSAITEKQNQLRQIEIDLKEIQNELETESIEAGHKVNAKIQEEQSNMAILQRRKDDVVHQSALLEKDISRFDEKLVDLREKWTKENERIYTHEHDSNGVCPTCNQSLPVEEIEVAKEKAVAAFNLAKATELENINGYGKAIAEDKAKSIELIEKLKATAESLQPQIEEKEIVVSKLTEELNALREAVKDARQDKRYIDKVHERQELDASIATIKENAQQAVSDIEKVVAELRAKRTNLNAQIAQQAQVTASLKRIGELEEQQKDLATEFEQLEHQLYLTEQFIQSKVKLLEERINSKFKYARFNLFKTNINGGIEEICETTYDGVPYSSGLNNAARINVGIDIINTLTEHYGIRAPIFVDNAEAVTNLAETDSQLISLIVSDPDKQLRVEVQA
ncbi:AAA family ATPase [Sporosarcina jiandibaonis]|uniref:AAA family ATPase n=1 Tax=Sporosarcina jiandibaonis TaxID=2715535 RepID=UPI001552ADD9|nr:AAA family ATPase [Sporosarcina jiandibaonis]